MVVPCTKLYFLICLIVSFLKTCLSFYSANILDYYNRTLCLQPSLSSLCKTFKFTSWCSSWSLLESLVPIDSMGVTYSNGSSSLSRGRSLKYTYT